MAADDVLAVLEKIDLFHGLSRKVLSRIVDGGREETFGPGEQVFAEGEEVGGFRSFSPKGVEMHVVLEGTAEAGVGGVTHGTLGPGSYFGEISLVDGGPRSADVAAGPDGMRTFALPKWTFAELLEQHPEIAVPMLRVMVGRLRAAEHQH
jgi:CRP-like cAMP-binding protein